MNEADVDALLVRSTDRYLNEYVPTEESARVWISGFTGSMGEVLVGKDRAYLAVDGRYWLQAEKEADPALYEVLKVPMSTGLDEALIEKIAALAAQSGSKKSEKLRVGFEPERISPASLDHFKRKLGDRAVLKPVYPSPVDAARGPVKTAAGKIR